MTTRVHIEGDPTPFEALALHREMFPADGAYLVKAEADPAEEEFEEWFLKALLQVCQERAKTMGEAIWEVLDNLLLERGWDKPSQLDFWELHYALMDMSHASTARMVGLRIPPEVLKSIQRLNLVAPGALSVYSYETLDFPALAYRMGLIYKSLQAGQAKTWGDLLHMAEAVPLSPAERSAVEFARQKAGMWLKPIFDQYGNVWKADREIAPLRARLSRVLESRQARREAARELGNSQRARGIIRDSRRVMRTEIANASGHGQWQADEAQGVKPGELMFRQTSATPCKDCLRLYKNADGTPRLYTREQVVAFDAGGTPNTGPREEWVPKIGSTHPNCVCPPWMVYDPLMSSLFQRRAPEFRELLVKLKVFPEAA